MAGEDAATAANALNERVRSLAEPVLARHGAELVELVVGKGRLLRVVADREGGIDLETCARVSEEVSRLLDAEDPISGRYTLEVTSPGLNRPLRTAADFRKNLGRKVRIVLARSQVEGEVKEVGEESVKVSSKGGDVDVRLEEIANAKILLPW